MFVGGRLRPTCSQAKDTSASTASSTGSSLGQRSSVGGPRISKERCNEIRSTIHGTLHNLAIMSAFMTSLAASIYASPPEEPQCWGQPGNAVVAVIEWLSMGCFFTSMILSIALSMDLDGVPDLLLVIHLNNTRFLHAGTTVFTVLGTWFMAMGYGVDLGERSGCIFFWFGLVAAPGFVIISTASFAYLYLQRRKLNEVLATKKMQGEPSLRGLKLGGSYFTCWYDLLPRDELENNEGDEIEKPDKRNNDEESERLGDCGEGDAWDDGDREIPEETMDNADRDHENQSKVHL